MKSIVEVEAADDIDDTRPGTRIGTYGSLISCNTEDQLELVGNIIASKNLYSHPVDTTYVNY
jgi:hypothetical protein